MTLATWPSELLKAGDLVVVAQGTGEPTTLLEELIDVASDLPETEVFVGLSRSGALTRPGARGLQLVSFGAMGPLAEFASGQSRLSIIPCNFADLPRLLAIRCPKQIVVLLQVSKPDAAGFHSLGVSLDYAYELVPSARVVVAEVNAQMPVTSGPRLHNSAFHAVVQTSRPLPTVPPATAKEVNTQIASHVAQLVPDGATLQLGVGALPTVVGSALTNKRNLRVRSTLAGDWLFSLARAGALSDEPGSVVICEAAGSTDLYRFVESSGVRFLPVHELSHPAALAGLNSFVALNSALQVDLTGQVNAEVLNSGHVGGIGGQADFLRSAQQSPGGRSVVMLPATARNRGESRIVRQLQNGVVTSPRSSVDFVVTEFGIADLRGRSLTERAEALTAVADPAHRASLLASS